MKEQVERMSTEVLNNIFPDNDHMSVFGRNYTMENQNYCITLEVLEVDTNEFDMPSLEVIDKVNGIQLEEWNVEEFLYGVHINDGESIQYLEEENLTEEGVRMIKDVIAVGVTQGWIKNNNK